MSGFWLMGRRMNDTTPMKNSTTNNTTGDTGCRMAHAEMFFMSVPTLRGPAAFGSTTFTVSPGRRNAPAVVTTSSSPCQAFGNHEAFGHRVADANGAALGLVLFVHDQHEGALRIGEHGGLRQHRALGRADDHFAARERAGAQRRIGLQRDADFTEPRVRDR